MKDLAQSFPVVALNSVRFGVQYVSPYMTYLLWSSIAGAMRTNADNPWDLREDPPWEIPWLNGMNHRFLFYILLSFSSLIFICYLFSLWPQNQRGKTVSQWDPAELQVRKNTFFICNFFILFDGAQISVRETRLFFIRLISSLWMFSVLSSMKAAKSKFKWEAETVQI